MSELHQSYLDVMAMPVTRRKRFVSEIHERIKKMNATKRPR